MIRGIIVLGLAMLTRTAGVSQVLQAPGPGEDTLAYLDRVNSLLASTMRGAPGDLTDLALLRPPAPGLSEPIVSVTRLHHRVPEKAKQAWRRASKLSSKGDADGATKELEKAVALDPDFAEAHNDLGVQYARRGRYQEAEAHFQRTTELMPESPAAHSNLAATLLQLGFRADAERNPRRAIELAPNGVSAHLLLGRLLSADPHTDK